MEQHVIVVGLGFGDEGKGATVDAFCAKEDFDLVVRFNGGQQAGHNVINNGRHHTFTQFGAGFFNGVPSHTSRYCSFDPLTFNREAAGLSNFTDVDPYKVHTVSPDAMLTTPLHVMGNHAMEARNGHGTVGVGFGETVRYSLAKDNYLTASDLKSPLRLEYKLWDLYGWYLSAEILPPNIDIEAMVQDLVKFGSPVNLAEDNEIMDLDNKRILFEGAQGVLLDEWVGFHPHTTWSRTTPYNAQEMINGEHPYSVVGVTRTYHTRHGAGPLHTEGGFSEAPRELHNHDDGFQGAWRTGGFSTALFDYAVKQAKPDYLSVTHVDVNAPVYKGWYWVETPRGYTTEEQWLDHMEEEGKGLLASSYKLLDTSALDVIQSKGRVILFSDGPNETDRRWV